MSLGLLPLRHPVIVNDLWATAPVFHHYRRLDEGGWSNDATDCGIPTWSGPEFGEGEKFGSSMPFSRAKQFARPCRRCFRPEATPHLHPSANDPSAYPPEGDVVTTAQGVCPLCGEFDGSRDCRCTPAEKQRASQPDCPICGHSIRRHRPGRACPAGCVLCRTQPVGAS